MVFHPLPEWKIVFEQKRRCDILRNMSDLPDCDLPLHPKALAGLELFNAGEFFEAHEELETAWREESGPIRDLYRGILQVAVSYLHITRGNYEGAIRLYERSQKWLSKWPDRCRGVDVAQLRADSEVVIAEIRRLGPEQIPAFDRSLFKPVTWHPTGTHDQ
jgi:predicted metal-dependent hydrolase